MTAIQKVFSDLEKLQPSLFDIHTQVGKEFIHHFHQYLELEKKQIIKAYNESFCLRDKPYATAEKYYNETYNK